MPHYASSGQLDNGEPLAHPDVRLFNQEDEALVLCAALNHTAGAAPFSHRLLGVLVPADFYLDEHQSIWTTLGELRDAGRDMDPLSVAAAAMQRRRPVGDPDYLPSLFTSPIYRAMPEASTLAAAARIRNSAMMRRARDAFVNLWRAAETNAAPVELLLQAASDEIANIQRHAAPSDSPMKPIIEPMIGAAEDILQRQGTDAGADTGSGVLTGFRDLDQELICLDGLTYIGARPGMGKTALLLALAHNTARQGRPTAVFELEMPDRKIALRYLASRSGITLNRLRADNNLRDDEQQLLLDSIHQAHEFPLYIDDTPGLTLPVLRARIREFARLHPRAVVYVDYLQLVAAPENFNGDRNWVGVVSAALRDLQRELGIPIIVLSQLNRGVEQRANRRPMMSDLRESGNLEQDASQILFIYRDEVYNPDSSDAGIAEIIVAKAREGRVGAVVPLRFRGDVQSFEDIMAPGAYE